MLLRLGSVAMLVVLSGTILETEEWEVSPDGKTYTYTEHDVGSEKPVVIILQRVSSQ
jgi:hypothetical protein